MSKITHTPRRWRAEKEMTHTAILTPLTRVGTIWKDEDAAHIVRCVNSHDALVEALKTAVDEMSYAQWFKPEAICARQDALKKARAALAKI